MSPTNVAVIEIAVPRGAATRPIVHCALPSESTIAGQLCAPSVSVTVWPLGEGAVVPSSSSVAFSVAGKPCATTVGPV